MIVAVCIASAWLIGGLGLAVHVLRLSMRLHRAAFAHLRWAFPPQATLPDFTLHMLVQDPFLLLTSPQAGWYWVFCPKHVRRQILASLAVHSAEKRGMLGEDLATLSHVVWTWAGQAHND